MSSFVSPSFWVLVSALVCLSGCVPQGNKKASSCDPSHQVPRCSSALAIQVCDGETSTWVLEELCPAGTACSEKSGTPSCAPLQTGDVCEVNEDCDAGVCNEGVCVSQDLLASCNNGTLDGDETYIDCGGSCPVKCADTRPCLVDADCQSACCEDATVCVNCDKTPPPPEDATHAPDLIDEDAAAVDLGPEDSGWVAEDAATDLVEEDTQEDPYVTLSFVTEKGDDGISCVDHCSIYLGYNSSRELRVVLTSDGEPLPDSIIQFSIENDENNVGMLSSQSAVTNASGEASVHVQAQGLGMGTFTVKATFEPPFPTEGPVQPIYFDVLVSPKSSVPLTVVPKYLGLKSVSSYQAHLFVQDASGQPTCSLDLLEAQPFLSGPLKPFTQSTKFSAEQLNFKFGVFVTVVLTSYDMNINPKTLLAWGCKDTDVYVAKDKSTTVTLQLEDIDM